MATGVDGRYIVRWSDAADIGSPGFGLLDELERRGLDVAADEYFRVQVTGHRARPRADNVAQIHLATGAYIDRWRAVPDAVEVATYDPRTEAQKAEYAAVRQRFIERLAAEGLDERIADVDFNLFGISTDVRLQRSRPGRPGDADRPSASRWRCSSPHRPPTTTPARCERHVDLKELPSGDDVRRHPWEIARARSYRRLIAAHADVDAARRVLDVGAGDGWFAVRHPP